MLDSDVAMLYHYPNKNNKKHLHFFKKSVIIINR